MKRKALFTALVLAAMNIPSLSEAAVTAIPTFNAVVSSTDTPRSDALATRELPSATTTRTAVASYSPAGCTGSTNYPHISGTDASVHGTMICNWAVTQVATAGSATRRSRATSRNATSPLGAAMPRHMLPASARVGIAIEDGQFIRAWKRA